MKKTLLFLALLASLTAFGQQPADTFRLNVCTKFWKTGVPVPRTVFAPPTGGGSPQLLGFSADTSCMELAFSPAVSVDSFCPAGAVRIGNDLLNGLTIRDLVHISRDILGVVPFQHRAQKLAADVNHSGSVTTFDILEMLKRILGKSSTWSDSTTWRFYSETWVFAPPSDPFLQNNCVGYDYDPATQSGQTALIGYKTGDVDGDADPNDHFQIDYQGQPAQLLLPDWSLAAGQVFDLPIALKTTNANSIAFQFTLRLDPDFVEAVDALPAGLLDFGSVHFNFLPGGAARFAFISNGPDFSDSTTLFLLRVRALQDFSVKEKINLAPGGLPAALLTDDDVFLPIESKYILLSEKTPGAAGAKIADAVPNPFREKTTVAVMLDRPQTVRLDVCDLAGRLVFSAEKQLPGGASQLEIPGNALPAGTAFFYRITAEGWSAYGRVLKM